MQEAFFTSKQAAEITGCTLRQLQYWREKGVVVPAISATGTGRSVYYSRSDLVELATMEYCLSVGLSFEAAATTLKKLKEKEPEFTNPERQSRFMLWWYHRERSLEVVEFELHIAMALIQEGELVIPVWLDRIHQRVAKRLAEESDRSN
ncbi:MerR family transcriptional regulator [Trichocoleus sp. ST-U3]